MPDVLQGAARLQRRGSSGELTEGSSRMTRGMQNFVKQIFQLYLNGTDLYRLQLAQSMAGGVPWDSRSVLTGDMRCAYRSLSCAPLCSWRGAWQDVLPLLRRSLPFY